VVLYLVTGSDGKVHRIGLLQNSLLQLHGVDGNDDMAAGPESPRLREVF